MIDAGDRGHVAGILGVLGVDLGLESRAQRRRRLEVGVLGEGLGGREETGDQQETQRAASSTSQQAARGEGRATNKHRQSERREATHEHVSAEEVVPPRRRPLPLLARVLAPAGKPPVGLAVHGDFGELLLPGEPPLGRVDARRELAVAGPGRAAEGAHSWALPVAREDARSERRLRDNLRRGARKGGGERPAGEGEGGGRRGEAKRAAKGGRGGRRRRRDGGGDEAGGHSGGDHVEAERARERVNVSRYELVPGWW